MEAIAVKILCSIIGLAGLWTGFRQLKNRAALDRWPSAPGQVIERGTWKPADATFAGRSFDYAPLIRYEYEVGTQKFTGDAIKPKRIQLPERSTQKWAQKKADRFPDRVTVHYNPADPAESYLIQASKIMLCLIIIISIFILLFGLLFY